MSGVKKPAGMTVSSSSPSCQAMCSRRCHMEPAVCGCRRGRQAAAVQHVSCHVQEGEQDAGTSGELS